jgi:hypothetical protein
VKETLNTSRDKERIKINRYINFVPAVYDLLFILNLSLESYGSVKVDKTKADNL